jgi:hypothetical protein
MTEVMELLDPPEPHPLLGVVVGRWGGWLVAVMPMAYNDRLILAGDDGKYGYDHGWCYPKGGAAALAARVWDPETQAEPPGYIKRATPIPRAAGERYRTLAERMAAYAAEQAAERARRAAHILMA